MGWPYIQKNVKQNRLWNKCSFEIVALVQYFNLKNGVLYIHLLSYNIWCLLYGAAKKLALEKVLLVSQKSIRAMLTYQDSVRQQFKELNILTVYGQMFYPWKIFHYETSVQQSNIDTKIHSYNTKGRAEVIRLLTTTCNSLPRKWYENLYGCK